MSVPNLPTEVLVTDTFEQWRVKTNSIISAVGNDTILLNELPEINANTVLGNSTTALARPIAITVATTGGITLTDNALKLVTPTGGITLTGGALSLATTVAGAGLALNSGVLSIPLTTTGIDTPTSNSGLKFVTAAAESGPIAQINAGLGVSLLANGGITLTGGALALVTPTGGITLTGGALALATTVAGAGLALNSGVLSVLTTLTSTVAGAGLSFNSGVLSLNAGEGLALNGDTLNIALTSAGVTHNSGLKFVTGASATGSDPQINAGLSVALASNSATTGQLGTGAILTTSNGGLQISSTGLSIAHVPHIIWRSYRAIGIAQTSTYHDAIVSAAVPAAYRGEVHAHGFGSIPSLIRVTASCITPDLGYAIADEIDASTIGQVWYNNIYVGIALVNATIRIHRKDASGIADMTKDRWIIVISAWK